MGMGVAILIYHALAHMILWIVTTPILTAEELEVQAIVELLARPKVRVELNPPI